MIEVTASVLLAFLLWKDSTEFSSSWRTRNCSSSEAESVGREEVEVIVPEISVWDLDGSDGVIILAYSDSAAFRITE